MNKVVSFEQYQGFVGEIRALKQGYVTNFFWDGNKHSYWVVDGSFEYQKSDKCILMIHHEGSFANLFYVATDYEVIKQAVENLEIDKDLVVDLVCRGEGHTERDAFKTVGFELYQSLYRMTHAGVLATPEREAFTEGVEFACKKDVSLVEDTFRTQFDPLSEQLPSRKEIEDYVEHKQLLIIKDDHKLCSFLIFEITGVSWYLRYWYTSPDYRNQGVGSRLLKTSLAYGIGTKRQMLWVISSNENAIKRYEHYGFKRELINDYVMIKRK
jgi:ribosomal protein S18 acetylase RimI-like enzyme